jgi:hypothetical protein
MFNPLKFIEILLSRRDFEVGDIKDLLITICWVVTSIGLVATLLIIVIRSHVTI